MFVYVFRLVFLQCWLNHLHPLQTICCTRLLIYACFMSLAAAMMTKLAERWNRSGRNKVIMGSHLVWVILWPCLLSTSPLSISCPYSNKNATKLLLTHLSTYAFEEESILTSKWIYFFYVSILFFFFFFFFAFNPAFFTSCFYIEFIKYKFQVLRI